MNSKALPPKEIALLDAAQAGDLQSVSRLISEGAIIDARDNRGLPWDQTPLMYAAENGHAEIVRILLAGGASVSAKDKAPSGEGGGQQPLHYAARGKNPEVVMLLLEAGAKMDAVDSSGQTPFNVAIDHDNSDLVARFLEQGVGVNPKARTKGKPVEPPLCAAVLKGKVNIVSTLLGVGADVNAVNELGQSPLYLVSSAPKDLSVSLVQLLIQAGAKLDLADNRGETALSKLTYRKDLEAVKLLVEAGADIQKIYPRQGGTILDAVEKRMGINPADAGSIKGTYDGSEWAAFRNFFLEIGVKRQSHIG